MDPLREIKNFLAQEAEDGSAKPRNMRQLTIALGKSHSYFRRPQKGLHRVPVDVVDALVELMDKSGWFDSEKQRNDFTDALLRLHIRAASEALVVPPQQAKVPQRGKNG